MTPLTNLETTRRLCVTCRLLCERAAMLRVLHDRQQQVMLLCPPGSEPPRGAQGRSAYVCNDPACVSAALKGKKLQRSLKTPLAGDIVTLLEAFCQTPDSSA